MRSPTSRSWEFAPGRRASSDLDKEDLKVSPVVLASLTNKGFS